MSHARKKNDFKIILIWYIIYEHTSRSMQYIFIDLMNIEWYSNFKTLHCLQIKL